MAYPTRGVNIDSADSLVAERAGPPTMHLAEYGLLRMIHRALIEGHPALEGQKKLTGDDKKISFWMVIQPQ